MPALSQWRRTAYMCAFAMSTNHDRRGSHLQARELEHPIGKGIAALTGPRRFNSDTNNCTDPTKPLNAWGMGIPQAELRKLNGDPTIVALALQEAWHCAAPAAAASTSPTPAVPRSRRRAPHRVRYVELTFTAAAHTPYHLWIRGSALADCLVQRLGLVQFSEHGRCRRSSTGSRRHAGRRDLLHRTVPELRSGRVGMERQPLGCAACPRRRLLLRIPADRTRSASSRARTACRSIKS